MDSILDGVDKQWRAVLVGACSWGSVRLLSALQPGSGIVALWHSRYIHAYKQASRQAGRQARKQTNIHTHTYIYIYM